MILYAIKHKNTENIYVGQTTQHIKKRWGQHRYDLRNNCHHNPHLQNAWNKYGENAFVFEILDETANNQDELNELEISYIGSAGYYNTKSGGASGKHSEESKKKMSEALQGRKHSEETKRKIGKSLKGRVPWNKGKINIYSEETKQKMSKSLMGRIAWNKGQKGLQVAWNKGMTSKSRDKEGMG